MSALERCGAFPSETDFSWTCRRPKGHDGSHSPIEPLPLIDLEPRKKGNWEMPAPADDKPVWKKGDRVAFAHRPDDEFTVSRFDPDPQNPMVELAGLPGLYGSHLFVAAPISLPPIELKPRAKKEWETPTIEKLDRPPVDEVLKRFARKEMSRSEANITLHRITGNYKRADRTIHLVTLMRRLGAKECRRILALVYDDLPGESR